MQTNCSYQLQHTGVNKVFSIHGRWKEHANKLFVGMQQTLNNHYRFYMEEDEYKTLFVDPTAQDSLKPKDLQIVNDWYCQAILDKLEQVEPSPEATDVIALLKQVLICYRHRNGDYIELDDLEDFGEMLDYFFDENNAHPEVKNYGKRQQKKYAVIYKKTTWLYPTEEGISRKDYIKITDCFVGYQTFTVPDISALTTEVTQIATGFKNMLNATKNSRAETKAAKEIIDTLDLAFSADVKLVYEKVQRLQRLRKHDILAFDNSLTKSTRASGVAVGTTINKNFIEWLTAPKTFLINKDGSSFRMLKYTSSTKKNDFYKSISKMTEWSPCGFYE